MKIVIVGSGQEHPVLVSLSVCPWLCPRPSLTILPARPLQRTITMHKDSTGHVGFVIKKGKIISLVKGALRPGNGLSPTTMCVR